jgi:hypothetical protein
MLKALPFPFPCSAFELTFDPDFPAAAGVNDPAECVTPFEEDTTLPKRAGIDEAGFSCELNVDSDALLASSRLALADGTAEKDRKTCSDKVCGEMGVGFLDTGLMGEATGDGPDPGDLLSSSADSGSSNSGWLASSGIFSHSEPCRAAQCRGGF